MLPVRLEKSVAFPLVVMIRQGLLLLSWMMLGGGMIRFLIRPLATLSRLETNAAQVVPFLVTYVLWLMEGLGNRPVQKLFPVLMGMTIVPPILRVPISFRILAWKLVW